MKMKDMLPLVVRIALGGIFIYAGLLKIADPVGFAGSIAAYKIVPYFGSYLFAAVLPWVEVIAGALLIAGVRMKSGAILVALLNVVFMVALASAIARGLDIDCGCFKQGGAKTSPWLALARDAVFLVMACYLLKRGGQKGREENEVEGA